MSATQQSADVAVIGLGAMGAATLYQLARRGVRAIGFDRFTPPHNRGSSHGETRITRQAIGEGEAYVPLALRSHAIWDELEAARGEKLIERCGYLALAADDANAVHHGKIGFVQTTIDAARRHNIVHDTPSPADVMRRFPQFALTGSESCYFEPGGGYVFPERCIDIQLRHARAMGATLHCDAAVRAIEPDGGGVRITTDASHWHATRAVIAAGAWVGDFLPGRLRRNFSVYRQVLHWVPVTQPELFAPQASPVFIWTHGSGHEDQIYGFPPLPGAATMKCAGEQYQVTVSPDSDWAQVRPDEGTAFVERHVRARIRGVGGQPARSEACLYTVTPDGDFMIDSAGSPQVTVVSACSGHGFKHSAAVGEAVAQRLCGDPSLLADGVFSATRFG